MKKPRITPRGPEIPKRRAQLRTIQKAIAVGNVDDVAAAIAALTGYTLSVSRVRRLLARIPVIKRDMVLRRFCREVAEKIDELEAAIQKEFDILTRKRVKAVQNKKNRSSKTGTNGNPGGVKDAG